MRIAALLLVLAACAPGPVSPPSPVRPVTDAAPSPSTCARACASFRRYPDACPREASTRCEATCDAANGVLVYPESFECAAEATSLEGLRACGAGFCP